jgi:hypothetical protein
MTTKYKLNITTPRKSVICVTAPQREFLNAFKIIFVFFHYSRYYSGQLGDLGSGAGKGGGGGGSIREAGGAFGKLEAGREEEYFYKQVSTVFKNSLIIILVWDS